MRKFKFDQLKMGAFISYFTMVFNIFAGLLYTPWMVSKIGQADYGLYTLANSLIAIFMLDFGLGSAVSRFVSKYRAEENDEAIRNIMGVIYKLYLIIDVGILAALSVVYIFIGRIYAELTVAELEKFRTLFIIVGAYQVIAFPFAPLDGLLNAYEKFIQLKICSLLYRLLSVFAVVGVLIFSSDVRVIILTNVLAHLATVLMKFIFARCYIPTRANFAAKGAALYKTLFSFTAWTTVISVMQRFTHSFAPSVLGMTSGALEIALYAPAVTLEGYFYTLGMSVNGLFMPRVSKFIANKQEDNILKLMIKVGRYQAVLMGLAYIGFICVGKEFMHLWMGPDYTKSYYLAVIILFPTLISATQQIAKTTVIAKKLIKYQAICMIFTGVMGLAISYLLSIRIGAAGVCIGTAVTSLVNIACMNVIYKKKAGINVFAFYKECYLKLIPCYGISALLGAAVMKCVPLSGWSGLVVRSGLIVAVFAVAIVCIYLTKDEKRQLSGSVKRLLGVK